MHGRDTTENGAENTIFFGISLLFIAQMWQIVQLEDLLEWLRAFWSGRLWGGEVELTGGPGGPGGPLGPSSPRGPCGGRKQG